MTDPYGQHIGTRDSPDAYGPPLSLAHLEFQLDITHTEVQVRRCGRGDMQHGLEEMAGVNLGVGQCHLRLRNDYPVAENRILRNQIDGRVQLTDSERRELAEMGAKLGKQALAEIATVAQADTLLA